jgi:hypothetical protein
MDDIMDDIECRRHMGVVLRAASAFWYQQTDENRIRLAYWLEHPLSKALMLEDYEQVGPI